MANYEIGYGKPPASGRFRAGVSGNPKGRPKRKPTPARRDHQDRAQRSDRVSGAGKNQGRDLSRTEPQDARRPAPSAAISTPPSWLSRSWLAPSATAIQASTRFWWRTGSPTIPVRPPIRKPPTSRLGATPRLPNGGGRPRIDREGQFTMFVPSTPRGRRISLGQLHFGQSKAHWALRPYRFKALRCGRRFGKTEFAKTWIAQGLVQGEECAWFAPQHMTWSEVYLDLTQMLRPILDASSRTPPVIRLSNGGRIDFWSLENPIAGRGRRYRRIVIDEAAHVRERLDRIVIVRGEAAVHDLPRYLGWLTEAEIGRPQQRAHHTLGGDRFRPDEVRVARQHAAEVLRPRPVLRAVDDHMINALRPQLLRLGRKPRKASTLPSRNSSIGLGSALVTQLMSLAGSSPTSAAIAETKT